MKKPKTPNLVPQGGWSYTDPDSGVRFKQSDINALVREVRRHRISNDLIVGAAWMTQFYHELCNQNPKAPCYDSEEPEVLWNADDVTSFVATLLEMRESGMQQVDQEEYDRRMSICFRCPKQGHVNCSSCGYFGGILQRVVAGVKVPHSSAPGKACMACGCTIEAKAAYPLEVLQKVDETLGRKPAYWEQCWMRE